MLNIKTLYTLIFFLLIIFPASAQSYWQQQADYDIKVFFDDVTNILTGRETITYYNNSPDTLRELYIHLWPNGYHSRSTPFAEQLVRNGNLKFQFAPQADLGYMDYVDFKAEGEVVKWDYTDDAKDIARIILAQPLLPRSRLRITTPFSVKLPADFSRMGRSKGGYQVTQWYPKMAVYDEHGWNPLHYLDQGEFYSDFGYYDVSITVPADLAVAATGELQTQSEIEWLKGRERISRAWIAGDSTAVFPEDTTGTTKTIRYTAENVIDFAWFADSKYLVNSQKFTVEGRSDSITAWTFFTAENQAGDQSRLSPWFKGIDDVVNSVQFYSEKVGPYPYKNVTAVSGALSAGGGMEYPTITVISDLSDLPTVILHEVGHNWFQGLLATNERKHPWMDEGINSYYENRYTDNKGKKDTDYDPGKYFTDRPVNFLNDPFYGLYVVRARQHLDQPENLSASDFEMLNYGIVVYGKVARDFKMLAAYLGQEEFDGIMQQYFREWKFKHPQPQDLERIFKAKASKDVSWFFDEMLVKDQNLDYAVKKVQQKNDTLLVTLKKKGAQYAPVLLNIIRNDSLVYQRWVEGVHKKTTVAVPVQDFDKVQINPNYWVPEVNLKNNQKGNGFPLRVRPLFANEVPGKHSLLVCPAFGYNVHDNFLLGAAFYNTLLPPSKFQYAVTPLFGFGSNELVGLGEIRYNFYKNPLAGNAPGLRQHYEIGLQAKSFNYDHIGDINYRYLRLSPYVQGTFQPKPLNGSQKFITRLRAVWVQKEDYGFDSVGLFPFDSDMMIFEDKMEFRDDHALHPTLASITMQYNAEEPFFKIWGEFMRKWIYNAKKKGIKLRLFAGAFALNGSESGIYNFRVGATTGRFDYMYDHLFFDRSAFPYQNFWSQQIVPSDAGFKLTSNLGNANEWMLAANLRADWPWVLPLKPYGSIATFNGADEIYYEAGIAFVISEGVAELYFPLFYNSRIRQAIDLNSDTYWAQITWMLNFHKLNPLDAMKLVEKLL